MNASARVVLLALTVAGLSACAHHRDRSARAERPLAPGESRIDQNSAYISEVERIARRRGIDVQWVNPPSSRRVAAVE